MKDISLESLQMCATLLSSASFGGTSAQLEPLLATHKKAVEEINTAIAEKEGSK